MTHGRVGIVIVTWNSEAEIGACLDAAIWTGAEIVVVDNASEDDTRKEVERRGVRLIANQHNRGFAAAVNQGVRVLDASLILLLNPDAVLLTGIETLAEKCECAEVGAAGGKLVDQQGRAQVGFVFRRLPRPVSLAFEALLLNRLWPRNPVNWQYRCLGLNHDLAREVEQPAGAFLMIRRDAWQKLGGFDESFYPLWFEDVDFCRRLLDRGYRLWYVPTAVAKHTGAHSISKIPLEFRELYWYGSLLKYGARHFHPWSARMVCLAVIVGSALRMLMGIAFRRSLKPIGVYYRVLRLAGRCLFSGRQGVEVLSFPLL